MTVLRFVLFAAAVLVLSVSAKPFTPEVLIETNKVAGPSVSSISTRFAYGITRYHNDTNKNTHYLYVSAADEHSEAYQIAAAGSLGMDLSPAFLPDDCVMFLSARSDTNDDPELADLQLYVSCPSDNYTTAKRASAFLGDIDTFKISRRGNRIAFSASVFPGMSLGETAAEVARRAAQRDNYEEWDQTFVRRWDAWWDGRYNHLHYANLQKDAETGEWTVDCKSIVDVMSPLRGDCPSRPFGGEEEYDISPEGDAIAYTTQLGNDQSFSTDLNIYLYDIAENRAECITCDNTATDTMPVFSPDSRRIAYLAMRLPKHESDTLKIRVYDRETMTTEKIAQDWDRSFGMLQWGENGACFYTSCVNASGTFFYRVDATGSNEVTEFAGVNNSGTFGMVRCPRSGKVFAVYSSQNYYLPTEIFRENIKNHEIRQLTFANKEYLADVEFTASKLVTYTGEEGDTIYAWMHFPPQFDETKSYPVIMYIHGGPEDCWNPDYHYRWNPQLIAARGYIVFAPNIHGSTCQGERFQASIIGDWGGKPFRDILRGLEYLKTLGYANTSRVAAMGASYGGYMMNWLNSQTDGVFRGIVQHDGLFDVEAFAYETDELYFVATEFLGMPTDKGAVYGNFSPARYADHMKTPTLIFHGGMDFRISEVQAFGLFNNLQRLGIESKLVRFPEENHWVVNPSNTLVWHHEVFSFLAKHLDD